MKRYSAGFLFNMFRTCLIAIGLGLATSLTSAQIDSNPAQPQRLEIDEQLVKAAGLRVLKGKFLNLYTDIRNREEIEQFPAVFDLAIPAWCRYFGIEPGQVDSLKLSAVLIADRNATERFAKAGLLPDDLPDFLAGYNRGHEMWIYLQPGDYYTRHLLLHEGTHAFMQLLLGSSGPAWYSEGMAELLGLHQWQDGQLRLAHRVRQSQDCPYWGRVRRIRDQVDAGTFLSLNDVMAIQAISFREVDAYAWSWAACEFLSHHPLTASVFKQLPNITTVPPQKFNRDLKVHLAEHREVLDRDWALFIREIDYGYAIQRGVLRDAEPLSAPGQFRILADHSWQQTGHAVKEGDRIRIVGQGRFAVQYRDRSLPCEAGGITIDYYRSRPLGELTMMILSPDGQSWSSPIAVGLGSEFDIEQSGTLCFRVNGSPARIDNNTGTVDIRVGQTSR